MYFISASSYVLKKQRVIVTAIVRQVIDRCGVFVAESIVSRCNLRKLECKVRRIVEISLIGVESSDAKSHVSVYRVFNNVFIRLRVCPLVSFND